MKNTVLAKNQNMLPAPRKVSPSTGTPSNGDSQPPANMIVVSAEIRIMLAYSARKKIANPDPEYSTWKPATISDSPSATSNGARLVSATPEIT